MGRRMAGFTRAAGSPNGPGRIRTAVRLAEPDTGANYVDDHMVWYYA
jgi:hypothetical protein